MPTYNHATFIANAIEGVVTQQTDFDFELLIGEDASSDETREICFAYQKRYPNIIRVLWSEHNLHHIGGNGQRIRPRVRGAFVAFCEGDDYWTHTHKLQTQVDVMRQHPSVSVCFTGGHLLHDDRLERCAWFDGRLVAGLNTGTVFFHKHMNHQVGFMLTCSALARRQTLEEHLYTQEIYGWRLAMGDSTMWLALSAHGDVWFDPAAMVVYRRHAGGATASSQRYLIKTDAALARIYYDMVINGVRPRQSRHALDAIGYRLEKLMEAPLRSRLKEASRIFRVAWSYAWIWHPAYFAELIFFTLGALPRVRMHTRRLIGIRRKVLSACRRFLRGDTRTAPDR